MVLSSFSPLMVAAQFSRWQEKAWVRQNGVYISQGILRTLTWREGTEIINFSIPYQLRTLVIGPRPLWQVPGCC